MLLSRIAFLCKAGGGSIRECYRTAYYVGGDATTARVLLDMPANLIPEDELGKGVVMLRAAPAKKAIQVFVPYVENASLYRLLGPSTYQASERDDAPAAVDFQQIPTVYTTINDKHVDKQDVYPRVNADEKPVHTISDDLFTEEVRNEHTHAQKPERAPVNEDIRKHIRRMHELGYPIGTSRKS